MLYSILALVVGLILLVWSADKFVDGAAGIAQHFGMSPLLIGMLILGFGTSAPEIFISTMASVDGNSDLALGNAVGSCITNIALILGFTGCLLPIGVHSNILKKELPLLSVVTLGASYLLYDYNLEKMDGIILLFGFVLFIGWTLWQGFSNPNDVLGEEMKDELETVKKPLPNSVSSLMVGMGILLGSSKLMVWGAVEIATLFGVSQIIIGLTIVAIGTSLPELAATFAAAKKGEHDLAIGNVLGSNLFNTLAVIGIAGTISPMSINSEIFNRDIVTMCVLTFSLFVFGYGFGKKHGRINRFEAFLLLCAYIGYTTYLVMSAKA